MDLNKEIEDKKVVSTDWNDMNIGELYSQKDILVSRLVAVANYPSMIDQIYVGMDQIDEIIQHKILTGGSKNKNIII